MKQLFILFVMMLSLQRTMAQSSGLQFNQALFLPVSIGAYSSANVGTVPAGKVWKLEQVAFSNANNSAEYYAFIFNNTAGHFTIPNSGSSSYNLQPDAVYWWPAGTQISIYSSTGSTSAAYVNILEFNIVQ